MKPGDLVRVRINHRPRNKSVSWFHPHNGKVGVIIESTRRGPLDVWRILLEDGLRLSFEPSNLEVIG